MDIFLQSIIEALKLIISLDSEVLSITLLSVRVSAVAIIFSSIIGIPLALLIHKKKFYGKNFLINIIHTLMGLPPVVAGLVVYIILSRQGWLGGLDLLFTPTAMILAQMVLAVPVIMGISITAFENVHKITQETIVSMGANWWQQLLALVREARFGLITAIITGFGAIISEVGAIIIVGGNIRYYTRALTTSIVLETRRGNFEMAMALGIILLALAFLINFILTTTQRRIAQR